MVDGVEDDEVVDGGVEDIILNKREVGDQILEVGVTLDRVNGRTAKERPHGLLKIIELSVSGCVRRCQAL